MRVSVTGFINFSVGLALLSFVAVYGQTAETKRVRHTVRKTERQHEEVERQNEKNEQHAHDEHVDEGASDTHEGGNHKDHDAKEGHSEHEDDGDSKLKFSSDELKEFSIELTRAKPGAISKTIDLSGEVIVAPDKLFHIHARVAGMVRKVFKELGGSVKEGDLLATLSSRELAETKAQLVAANSRLQLTNANLKRERDLYKKKVTAEQEYLQAKQAQTEASIQLKLAKQRLLALGLSNQDISSVLLSDSSDLTRFELRAPADGIIIAKHAVRTDFHAPPFRGKPAGISRRHRLG